MLTDWMYRLRSLFRRDAVPPERDQELRIHVDQQVAAHERRDSSALAGGGTRVPRTAIRAAAHQGHRRRRMGVARLDGREFEVTDIGPSLPVIVVNRTAARQLFGVVTVAESYTPARRATRIDPLVALRSE